MIIFDVTGPRCPLSSEKDAGWSRSGGWGATSTVFVHLSTSWTDREGQDASKVNIMTILWTYWYYTNLLCKKLTKEFFAYFY